VPEIACFNANPNHNTNPKLNPNPNTNSKSNPKPTYPTTTSWYSTY